MRKIKKTPQRKCIGCNEIREKKQLIRIVKTPEQTYLVDKTGKKSGRGAYICSNIECLQKAIKGKGLEKSFKEKVPDEVYENLKNIFEGEV